MATTQIARPGVTRRRILVVSRRGEVFSVVLGFVSTTTSQWTYLSPQ
jgi:hypothetical protein